MKAFSIRRALAVAKKEVFHIMRDPFTLGAALGLPVFMVVVFGIAIEFNVKNIVLAVSDSDKSQASRRLLDTFKSSSYFQIADQLSPGEAIDTLTSENARAALMIPLDFERDLLAGRNAAEQILLHASDSSTVARVSGYVGAIENSA